MPRPVTLKIWSWTVLWRLTRPFRTNTKKKKKKDVLFIIGDWNAKVGSQEIPGVKGKFGLGVQNGKGQRLTSFAKRTQWSQQTPSYNTREDSTHVHHQMVNTEIRLMIFFAAEDGEALYNQQKQDWELTVAQIMNSLLQNSDLDWRKWGNHWTIQVWPKSNPLRLYSGSEK